VRSTDVRQLWIPLAAIPALWAAQELLSWFLSAPACVGSRGMARAGIAIPTAGALIAAAIASASSRRALLAFTSLGVASALGLGLVYAGLPVLGMSECGASAP
jgi:hypothetical protein